MRDYDGLFRFLAERSAMPFEWGRDANDCVSHALGAIAALGGAPDLDGLGQWTTEQGAARIIIRLGGMEAAVSRFLRPIAPAMAQRGDIAGVPTDDGGLLLMVVEGDTLVGPDLGGHTRVKRSRATHAWSAM